MVTRPECITSLASLCSRQICQSPPVSPIPVALCNSIAMELDRALGPLSLDVSAGCGSRHSTLLDEYERLAIEAQLNRAVLRRSYSEPSPARFARSEGAPPAVHCAEKAGWWHEPAAGRLWWLGEVARRWLEALRPVFCWFGRAWDGRTKEPAVSCPPAVVPRVQLLHYLR